MALDVIKVEKMVFLNKLKKKWGKNLKKKALHAIGVDTLVAPYEADAQLAFLSRSNIAQIVITEDSDLIPFGCEKVKS